MAPPCPTAKYEDWRKAEIAADYLRARVFDRDPGERQWALKHGRAPREFHEMVGGVKLWIDLRARKLEQVLTGKKAA